MLDEGWYLMSTTQLERELERYRCPERAQRPSGAVSLTTQQALAYRNAGNVPDSLGRTLRLVLHVEDPDALHALDAKRRRYEPDYLSAPVWRREGSVPVNVVPLRPRDLAGDPRPWWEAADVAPLESEWRATGRLSGLAVPGEYRGFVYKTVLALRAAGLPVTPDSVADGIQRWVPPGEAARIRAALRSANRRFATRPPRPSV